jgi:hypothetical protein
MGRIGQMKIEDFPYVVYSGLEKLDLGPKSPMALCSSQKQAEALIKAMSPGFGYWEKAESSSSGSGGQTTTGSM